MRNIIYFYLLPILLAFSISSIFLWDSKSYLQEQLIWLVLLVYLLIRFIIGQIKLGIVILSVLFAGTILYMSLMASSFCGFDYGCHLEHGDKSGLFGLFL